jgi:hypothetical protein
VLARGAERPRLGLSSVERELDVPASWRVAWSAAVELLRLRERQ